MTTFSEISMTRPPGGDGLAVTITAPRDHPLEPNPSMFDGIAPGFGTTSDGTAYYAVNGANAEAAALGYDEKTGHPFLVRGAR